MRRRRGVRISTTTVRTLSKVADLPLNEAQTQKAREAMERFAAEQQGLYGLDLTSVEPPFAFDPRWE